MSSFDTTIGQRVAQFAVRYTCVAAGASIGVVLVSVALEGVVA